MTVNGERLTMTKGETELEMIPYVEGGELVIVWQKHREGLGNAVEITTGVPHISSLPFRIPAICCQASYRSLWFSKVLITTANSGLLGACICQSWASCCLNLHVRVSCTEGNGGSL